MPKLVKLEVVELPSLLVVGKELHLPGNMDVNPIPEFWQQCFAHGTFAVLEALDEYLVERDYVGWIGDWDGEYFYYICGMLLKPGAPVPEGFVQRELPPTKVAVAWIQGPEEEVIPYAHSITVQAAEQQGYSYDQGPNWSLELYNCPRYTEPNEQGEVILDYYLPVK